MSELTVKLNKTETTSIISAQDSELGIDYAIHFDIASQSFSVYMYDHNDWSAPFVKVENTNLVTVEKALKLYAQPEFNHLVKVAQ